MKGVAVALLFAGKAPIRTTPGRPKKQTLSPTGTSRKKPMVPKPAADIHYDEIHHWSEFGNKRNRCRRYSMLCILL